MTDETGHIAKATMMGHNNDDTDDTRTSLMALSSRDGHCEAEQVHQMNEEQRQVNLNLCRGYMLNNIILK